MRNRFAAGQAVWVSPFTNGSTLVEDGAIVMDDLGDGYIVLQESELVPSYGMGHFAQDIEVTAMMN